MTHEEFIALVRNQQSVKGLHVLELKELTEKYPYFVSPRVLLSKAMNLSNDISATENINLTTIYCADRHKFHDYIFPKETIVEEQSRIVRTSKNSGNYFDMIHAIESQGGDTRQSLKSLAEKLKEAREMVVSQPNTKSIVSNSESEQKPVRAEITDYFNMPTDTIRSESPELIIKKMIEERKYSEAIEILRSFNLNNPKKSVYFADQIRFLEKVILNSK
ncbi:MAG: hypothetical protein WCL70_00280 [Paludibacter sp.]